MSEADSRAKLIEAFKSCLNSSAKGRLEFNGKYSELASQSDSATIIWSLDQKWFIEGEIYDANGSYQQRKVVANFSPGDFLILPTEQTPKLKLYARSDSEGSWYYTSISSLLENVKTKSLLEIIAGKISYCFVQLFEFERDLLKPTLSRPQILKPDESIKLPSGKMALSSAQNIWVPRNKLNLLPNPFSSADHLPEYFFIHEGSAIINQNEDIVQVEALSNQSFFTQVNVTSFLTEQSNFQWRELIHRWSNHFKRNRQLEEDHFTRKDIYSQSVKSRLLNLLSGKKSYLPKTSNHFLRSAFYLINHNGWIPSLPKKTDYEDRYELLSKIAESSELIIRKSILKGKWWQKDSGSFIAFDQEGDSFVLFFKGGGYRIWNPITNKHDKIGKKLRVNLSPKIVFFYKQFPSQPLTLFDLIFFEVQSVRKEIFFILFLAVIMSGLIALLPVLSAFVVNVLLPSALVNLLAIVCGGLVVVGVFQTMFTWFNTMIMTRVDYKLELASSAALWHRVLHFPSSLLRQHASGDIAMRMTSFLGMQQFFRAIAHKVVTMTFQIATSLGVVFWVHFEVGMGVLGFGLIAFLAALGFTYWQIRAFMAGEKSLGIVNSFILEMYSGVHKIKAAGAEDECLQQWAERYSRLRKKLLSSQKVRIVHSSFQAGWVTLTTALVYWLIVGLGEVNIEPAKFIAFLGAFAVFSGNLSGLCSMVVQSGIQIPMYKFIKLLLEKTPECKADLMIPDKVSGNLKADRVSYYYPNQNNAAVQQVTLSVKQGSFVVLVGGSGSGKSTLGKLLCGLDSPSNGQVFLDDYELHTLDPTALRSNIAVVPQNFRMINGTLHDNIKGAVEASLDDVIEAAKAACIWDEIDELPMKLHTLTGTQFGAFSGGQIQRVAIARALIRKPRILIMDEATSALDNSLQKQIIENIRSMNCTVIFIAHRLQIAEQADQIFVMDSGEIVERGTHDELLSYQKFYAKMWSALR
jgi:ABC-type bacteriocin/lantibiotic exporter with double-glycine peptidase domain